jgi:hypothetical protein
MRITTLLWCQQGTHDKLWGIVQTDDGPITFWGRRGAQLTFKRDHRDLYELSHQKRRKGYRSVTVEEVANATEDFEASFRKMFIKAKLRDQYHGEPEREPVEI